MFEVDGQLRVDRAEGVVDALESLGPIGAAALGGTGFGLDRTVDSVSNQQMNERNIELEVAEMIQPLVDLVERRSSKSD